MASEMNSQTIAAKFVKILSEQVDVSLNYVTPSTRFLEDLKMDDLEPVEVIMAVEEEFGIGEIPEKDCESLEQVGEMIEYLFIRLSQDDSGRPPEHDGGDSGKI